MNLLRNRIASNFPAPFPSGFRCKSDGDVSGGHEGGPDTMEVHRWRTARRLPQAVATSAGGRGPRSAGCWLPERSRARCSRGRSPRSLAPEAVPPPTALRRGSQRRVLAARRKPTPRPVRSAIRKIARLVGRVMVVAQGRTGPLSNQRLSKPQRATTPRSVVGVRKRTKITGELGGQIWPLNSPLSTTDLV
jgi:hypothetical protein